MIRLVLTLAIFLAAAHSVAGEEEDGDKDDSRTATISKTFQIKLESKSAMCVATAELDYSQRGVEAQVETVVDAKDCDTASGNYVVKVTIRSDADGQARVLDFKESWNRTEGLPFESMRRYPIGDEVELKKVRIRKLSCTCADQGTED